MTCACLVDKGAVTNRVFRCYSETYPIDGLLIHMVYEGRDKVVACMSPTLTSCCSSYKLQFVVTDYLQNAQVNYWHIPWIP